MERGNEADATSRVVSALTIASLAVALGATLVFVFGTLGARLPYWGEAEVVFEASRLRQGFPLFVDPIAGAHEYGEPASRYYVTYPPLWTWIVSLVPARAALVFARIVSIAAWFGALAGLALGAVPSARRSARIASAFAGGIWVLANFAMVGRPDSVACAVAAVALALTMRKGHASVGLVALFVLVPWLKPTVIGLPVGALVGALIADRSRAPRTIGIAAALVLASTAIAQLASGGALFAHVVQATAQPFALAAWLEQVPTRLPFFAPLFVWAAWVGWCARASAGAKIGLTALGSSIAWTLFALAKTGSSSNYWMEPCIAAVALIAATPPPALGGKPIVRALAGLAVVVWVDVASVRAALEHLAHERAAARFVATARDRCAIASDEPVLSDEAGVELALDGRIVTTTYQLVHLARSGAYPVAVWRAELVAAPCFVEHTGHLGLVPALAAAVVDAHRVVAEEAGYRIWRAR